MAALPKKMKLKEILSHIDGTTPIKVCCFENNSDEEYFKGSAWNCPWCVAECYLDTNSEGEAISIGIDKETQTSIMYIYVKEEDEK